MFFFLSEIQGCSVLSVLTENLHWPIQDDRQIASDRNLNSHNRSARGQQENATQAEDSVNYFADALPGGHDSVI